MKTAGEILIEFGCPDVTFDENVTMYYPAILSAMEEYANARVDEAMRWRDPKEELPEVGMKVLVKTSNGKYSVTEMYIYKESSGATLGAEWRGSYDFRMSVIGWRPIE